MLHRALQKTAGVFDNTTTHLQPLPVNKPKNAQVRMKERTNVGVMMSGQGATADVWAATEKFLKERRRLKEAQEQASKARAYSPAQAEARRCVSFHVLCAPARAAASVHGVGATAQREGERRQVCCAMLKGCHPSAYPPPPHLTPPCPQGRRQRAAPPEHGHVCQDW